MSSPLPDDSQRRYPDDTRRPRFVVEEGGLKDEKPTAPPGVDAVRKAMDVAMRSGDWGHVKELATVMEQLWALKAAEVGR